MLTRCLAIPAACTILAIPAACTILAIAPAFAQSVSVAPSGSLANFLSRQTSDQWLVTKFIDRTVFGTDGMPVGTIKDLVVDRDGTIAGVVVGITGGNGAGDKTIGVPFKSLQVTRASNNEERFVLQVTRSDLRNAPDFAAGESGATTGAGSSGLR